MDFDELPFSDELRGQVWRGKALRLARSTVPTGFAALDDDLPGGGWPRGALIEVFVERYGIGELTLLIPALAALTHGGPGRPPQAARTRKWVAWIAPPFVPYAPALQQRGVGVDGLLIVQPSASRKDRLWTLEQVIRSGSISGVLAWLSAADHIALRRLQLAAEEQSCWTVLFRPFAARREPSVAALRIALEREDGATFVRIDHCRGARPGVVDITASLTSLERGFGEDGFARAPGSKFAARPKAEAARVPPG
jgi:cell division inhibitor SulA/protein ImuA